MATKEAATRFGSDNIKADLRSTSTCSATTVAALQDLLLTKDEEPAQKENARVKGPTAARRRAATAPTVEPAKQTPPALSPREKYILATEIANVALKNLAEALKSPTNAPTQRPSPQSKPSPTEDARKAARSRTGHTKSASVSKRPLNERSVSQISNAQRKPAMRRSSSYSSIMATGPDAGLVATAECARIAFTYLGTSEATKVLGKDSQELQLENGILALVGKLVALGLDGLAVKEMRHLKRRLDKYLGQESPAKPPGTGPGEKEKESMATLLDFGAINVESPAVPLIANFQIYVLRVMAKLNRPRIVEAAWEHLKLSNPSSPANLIHHVAISSNTPAKVARQLESLAQTILALCPNISSSHDVKPLQPSPETVLLLQQLAFKVRQDWWTLAKHKCDLEQELLEPFSKCLVAFARRSQLSPSNKYRMAESLYVDLVGSQSQSGGSSSAVSKTLSSLAQAAGISDEALRWLGSTNSTPQSNASQLKHAARLLRIATVSIEAPVKGDTKPGLDDIIISALEALQGNLSGSSSDLDALFLEANALRRAATRLLMAHLSKPDDDREDSGTGRQAVRIIAATVHYSTRMVGAKLPELGDVKAQQRHTERMAMVSKCVKSIIDSVMACCKEILVSEQQWNEVDTMLQECSHLLLRFEEEVSSGGSSNLPDHDAHQMLFIKLSNAYWAVYLQLRKTKLGSDIITTAMQRSVTLLHSRSQDIKNQGHVAMKLEQIGDTFEGLGRVKKCRNAYSECICAHVESFTSQALSTLTATSSLHEIFEEGGPLATMARVLRSCHRSYVMSGLSRAEDLAFFDNPELESGARGALLEWQLGLYLRTLSKNRHWDSGLNSSIATLADRLQEIYLPGRYPIRHLRLQLLLLQLSQNHDIVPSRDVSMSDATTGSTAGSEDEGLARFDVHLNAMYSLKTSLQQDMPPTSTLRESFSAWESLADSATSWEFLVNRVDDVECWISDIKASVEFLNAKGEEYMALPVLHLLVKLDDLQNAPDPSQRIATLCALGIQFLRLGYTGRAGLSLAKAEALVARQTVSTEAKLRWHIAYAEYLARIGSSMKCTTILSAAQALALADGQFMDLAKSSTTLSGRLRFNRIVADAAYVSSLLASITGDYKDASRHAKQCVTLNRRLWAALESRVNVKKASSVEDAESSIDESSKANFDPLASMRNDKGAPLVTSVTHEALNGADFWALVPALYQGLMQHSQVFAHQGLLHEAIYIAEQADKVACATKSPTLITDNAAWRADCWAQSGRPDKAKPILDSLAKDANRKCLSVVGYQSAIARVHHWNGQYEDEITAYGTLDQLLQDLTSPTYIKALDRFVSDIDGLAEQMSQMTVDASVTQPVKVATATRGRKPATKPAPRTASRSVSKPAPRARSTVTAGAKKAVVTKSTSTSSESMEVTSSAEQCSVLSSFQTSIKHRGVLANLLQEDLATATALLAQIEKLQGSLTQDISHVWATFKMLLAQSFKQIAENIAINTLPESTIAFPAVNLKERRSSEGATVKRAPLATLATAKGSRAKKQVKEDFVDTLRTARDRLVEAHAASAMNGPNYMFQQVSMALGSVTVLLSAVSGTELGASLHPLYAAYMGEVPKCNALRLMQESVEAEKEQLSRDECLRWPTSSCSSFAPANVSDFQRDYIDIIPDTWTAVSMALNDTRDELYITRYESGTSPFLLRLPLARHASRDMDEEEFSFEDGKRDFDELIELSDFSTRTAKDMTSREARQQWWTEREALDTRLHELLLNIEIIWLGGFRGVFSQHERQPNLLARFRKSLENILNQHLPSRRKKTQQKRPTLDARVLELFVGLGDATDEKLDLDEALMDLIYFVVDILHFNGERNAYDEIDFDAMVVETQEALRAYHGETQQTTQSTQHMILILDNNLHGFPWESLPCLEKLSISRLPSLAALRERLLVARPSTNQQDPQAGHFISAASGGTSILNPGGDLSHTTKTLKPRLDELHGPWSHIANRAPTEKEFEDSLREKDLVLYFGHGSGAQFVRSKSVRRLYPGAQADHNSRPGCATTLLFGCSSVHLTENGIYEPSGMLASYLTAGAPAVVGMLWDVTDKDCDRLAVKAGELWGLWPEPQEDVAPVAPPKTPGRKAKGKGRVAQLLDDVEGPRTPGSAKKSKKAKNATAETELAADRRRGLGLDECVREARKACVLRYLNGAAAVVYGIPVYLE
ncbi:hypothetical protein CC86DRAFT_469265 [Ophiobolus disseminans]|uniref:separase n=1 Tax=Ophiobolus disseminans TaxID=1469910 RepID=A0A6A6ZT44_9PLEO|nr:hypothetical protein CC86DRAFT_469265 [Ophiobolus disseminans]